MITNPLDKHFGLGAEDEVYDDDYAMTEVDPNLPQAPQPDIKDEDDLLIEKRIDEVYDAAMETFQQQTAMVEVIEPRYAARTAEVAANYLSIALQAATSRAKVKTDRKRGNQFVPFSGGGRSTTNILVANREEILKMISIDGETKQL